MSDWTLPRTLEYYYIDGRHVVFNKYAIFVWGEIINKRTQNSIGYTISKDGYQTAGVVNDIDLKKQQRIVVARAMVSTFQGRPSKNHTVDHLESSNKSNDIIFELGWMSRNGQIKNRQMPTDYKSALVIVKDGVQKTAKEWAEMTGKTAQAITHHAQRRTQGYSYKRYPNLSGEHWKIIPESKNSHGYWEISTKNRYAYVSKFARNVFDKTRFYMNGYPSITINGQHEFAHVISFRTWFPTRWARRQENEHVLHEDDDRFDFRPWKLRLGTQSENMKDAHRNNKYDGGKSARRSCVSFVNGEFEKHHESLIDAKNYLDMKNIPEVSLKSISRALDKYISGNENNVKYGRTWVAL